MKKLQKSRFSILLTLLMVSSFLMVFTNFPAVVAGPDIPMESEYNGWHWGVEVCITHNGVNNKCNYTCKN